MTPEEMVTRLLYRDGLMLVVDKPAGIAVHRGPKGGESLEDHFDALRFGLPRAPALAHRLDRDTTGCLVLGRHRKALATLGRLFKAGRVGKTYWAVVEGGPAETEGRIELPLGRMDETRGWWMKPDPHGQPATTIWKVLGRFSAPPPCGEELGVRDASFQATGADTARRPDPPPRPSPARGEGAPRAWDDGVPHALTWLALEPLTGRTHQLRVHCAAMGWPVIGDAIYGTKARLHGPRQDGALSGGGAHLHLHSREIVVPLYKNREPIRIVAPVPRSMWKLLSACGLPGEATA